MRDFGKEVLEDMRDQVSEPYPPASQGGNPPHLRSSAFHDSLYEELSRESSTRLIEKVTYDPSKAPHGKFLAKGTSRMDSRPFVPPMRAKWSPQFSHRLKQAIRNG